MKRTLICLIILASSLACTLGTANREVPTTSDETSAAPTQTLYTATPTAEATNTPAPTDVLVPPNPTPTFGPATQITIEITPPLSDRNWMLLQSDELGISFELPPVDGAITYAYTVWPESPGDPNGTNVTWEVSTPASWAYAFAGGASADFRIGRSGWPTDGIRWRQDGERYVVDFPVDRSIEITPLRIVTHPSGATGIIYDADDFFGTEMNPNPSGADRVAILNFPAGHHPEIECLNIYFYEDVSLDDIEAALLSVTFTP